MQLETTQLKKYVYVVIIWICQVFALPYDLHINYEIIIAKYYHSNPTVYKYFWIHGKSFSRENVGNISLAVRYLEFPLDSLHWHLKLDIKTLQ